MEKDLIESRFPADIYSRMKVYAKLYPLGNYLVSERVVVDPQKDIRWVSTPEGFNFWNEVVYYKNFELYYDTYPKEIVFQIKHIYEL